MTDVGDDVEREADRARLINSVAAFVREVDGKITMGQPGRAYTEVHHLDDACGLFERRTVMRWNRERARAREKTVACTFETGRAVSGPCTRCSLPESVAGLPHQGIDGSRHPWIGEPTLCGQPIELLDVGTWTHTLAAMQADASLLYHDATPERRGAR